MSRVWLRLDSRLSLFAASPMRWPMSGLNCCPLSCRLAVLLDCVPSSPHCASRNHVYSGGLCNFNYLEIKFLSALVFGRQWVMLMFLERKEMPDGLYERSGLPFSISKL